MSTYEKKREATQNSLLTAFWQLYEETDFDKLTVKAIVERAGFDRATFYRYFDSVADCLACIEDRLMAEAEASWEYSRVHISNPEEAVRDAVSLFTANARYYRVLFSTKGDKVFISKSMDSIKRLLKVGLSEQRISNAAELDFTLEFICGGIISALNYWFTTQSFSQEELVRRLHLLQSALLRTGVV